MSVRRAACLSGVLRHEETQTPGVCWTPKSLLFLVPQASQEQWRQHISDLREVQGTPTLHNWYLRLIQLLALLLFTAKPLNQTNAEVKGGPSCGAKGFRVLVKTKPFSWQSCGSIVTAFSWNLLGQWLPKRSLPVGQAGFYTGTLMSTLPSVHWVMSNGSRSSLTTIKTSCASPEHFFHLLGSLVICPSWQWLLGIQSWICDPNLVNIQHCTT